MVSTKPRMDDGGLTIAVSAYQATHKVIHTQSAYKETVVRPMLLCGLATIVLRVSIWACSIVVKAM